MTLDPYSFGKSLTSVQLTRELEKVPKSMKRKITNHLNEFNEGLNSLALMPNHTHMRLLAKMWMERHFDHGLVIRSNPDFNLDSAMKNVIKYRYRMWLETHGGISNKRELANRESKNAIHKARAEKWVKNNITP